MYAAPVGKPPGRDDQGPRLSSDELFVLGTTAVPAPQPAPGTGEASDDSKTLLRTDGVVRSGQTSLSTLAQRVAAAQDGEANVFLTERYRLLRILGAGGMGAVYLAENVTIGKMVAIKILIETDPELARRMMREARTASKIRHENVVDVLDFGMSDDGLPFLVMEYIDGEDLAALIKREAPLSWSATADMMRQVCGALQAAHEKHIVHRDMKPANCLITRRSQSPRFVKVLDFGIAKITSDDRPSTTLTQDGSIIGTPVYMSPEQAMAEPLDSRSDIYSMGVMMFEMLSGVPPFTASNPMGVLTKHITQPPPRLSERVPNIDPAIEQIVMRCLEKERDRRYPTAQALLDAILEIDTRPQPAVASPPGVWRRFPKFALLGASVLSLALLVLGLVMTPLLDAEPIPPVEQPAQPASATRTPDPSPPPKAVPPPEPIVIPAPVQPPPPKEPQPEARTAVDGSQAKSASSKPVLEVLTVSHLRTSLSGKKSALKQCQDSGGYPGMRLQFEVSVDARGAVKDVRIQKPYDGTDLGRCLSGVLRALKLPRSKSGAELQDVLSL